MPDTPRPRPRTRAKTAPAPDSNPAPDPQAAAASPRENRPKAPDDPVGRVAGAARQVGKSLQASSQKWAAGNAEIGLRMIDQAEQNVQQAFAAMRAAAKAKDIAEVMKIQAEFVREQRERSVTQARQIGEMIVQVGRDSVTPLRPGGAGSS
jgi:phasin family protein